MPDFGSVIETNRASWAMEIIDSNNNSDWEYVFKSILNPVGGIYAIREDVCFFN